MESRAKWSLCGHCPHSLLHDVKRAETLGSRGDRLSTWALNVEALPWPWPRCWLWREAEAQTCQACPGPPTLALVSFSMAPGHRVLPLRTQQPEALGRATCGHQCRPQHLGPGSSLKRRLSPCGRGGLSLVLPRQQCPPFSPPCSKLMARTGQALQSPSPGWRVSPAARFLLVGDTGAISLVGERGQRRLVRACVQVARAVVGGRGLWARGSAQAAGPWAEHGASQWPNGAGSSQSQGQQQARGLFPPPRAAPPHVLTTAPGEPRANPSPLTAATPGLPGLPWELPSAAAPGPGSGWVVCQASSGRLLCAAGSSVAGGPPGHHLSPWGMSCH